MNSVSEGSDSKIQEALETAKDNNIELKGLQSFFS